jgi:hypothetical protein
MTCLVCRDLTRVLKSAHTEYRAACAASFYFVSTQLVARKQVDMERAKTALNEHQSFCESHRHVAILNQACGEAAGFLFLGE